MKGLFKTIHEKYRRGLPNSRERVTPEESQIATYMKKETEVSQKLTIMLLVKYKQLTSEQRYAIYLGKQKGTSRRVIARSIGVSPSTVSGEIRRNSNRHGRYSWRLAQDRKER